MVTLTDSRVTFHLCYQDNRVALTIELENKRKIEAFSHIDRDAYRLFLTNALRELDGKLPLKTKDEFVKHYASRCPGMTLEEILGGMVAVPCDCDEGDCQGWRMQSKAWMEKEAAMAQENERRRQAGISLLGGNGPDSVRSTQLLHHEGKQPEQIDRANPEAMQPKSKREPYGYTMGGVPMYPPPDDANGRTYTNIDDVLHRFAMAGPHPQQLWDTLRRLCFTEPHIKAVMQLLDKFQIPWFIALEKIITLMIEQRDLYKSRVERLMIHAPLGFDVDKQQMELLTKAFTLNPNVKPDTKRGVPASPSEINWAIRLLALKARGRQTL